MQRSIFNLAAAIALSVLTTSPASAITDGVEDNEHTNVGVLGVEYEPGLAFFFCSGTLVAPDVFVTAAHCLAGLFQTDPNVLPRIIVSFDTEFVVGSEVVPAKATYFDPAFGHDLGDLHDLGVVLLSEEVTEWNGELVEPAELPTSSLLDELAADGGLHGTSFVNVGFGADALLRGRPGIDWAAAGTRRVSTSPFLALNPPYLRLLQNNNATGEGGACYDDSGGPKFLPDTNTIVAVQVAGTDPHCRAASVAYRLDTPEARAFLEQFVPLP